MKPLKQKVSLTLDENIIKELYELTTYDIAELFVKKIQKDLSIKTAFQSIDISIKIAQEAN